MTITTHVCRGNYHSDWACSGPYDAVSKTLFAQEKVDAFYLEFDDERQEVLRHWQMWQKVWMWCLD